MPLAYILDIEELVAPISPEKPAGIDIREDGSASSSYYLVKDARNAGRAAERAAILDPMTDVISPWQTVANEAAKVLKTQSKDIEITCWLIEAMIRLYGYTGLRDGFVILEKIVDEYWEDLYPEPDEDGIETKVRPITGLNGESGEGTLLTPMRNSLLSDAYSDSPFTLWEYQQALNADNIPDSKQKAARNQELGYSLATIQNSIRVSNGQFFTDFFATINEANDSFKKLMQTLRSHCGQDTPPSSNISNLLEEVLRTCEFIYKDKLARETPEKTETPAKGDEASESTSGTVAQTGAQVTTADGAIANREDALRRMLDIADYFREAEPHSPLASGLERLVKWGRMSVTELMLELLPDGPAKTQFTQLTGVSFINEDGTEATPSGSAASNTSGKAAAPAASAQPAAAASTNLGWGPGR